MLQPHVAQDTKTPLGLSCQSSSAGAGFRVGEKRTRKEEAWVFALAMKAADVFQRDFFERGKMCKAPAGNFDPMFENMHTEQVPAPSL